jgi:hypothetical protein
VTAESRVSESPSVGKPPFDEELCEEGIPPFFHGVSIFGGDRRRRVERSPV